MKLEELNRPTKKLIERIEKRFRRSKTITDKDMALTGLYLFDKYHIEEEEE
jgi:hypothetical protein